MSAGIASGYKEAVGGMSHKNIISKYPNNSHTVGFYGRHAQSWRDLDNQPLLVLHFLFIDVQLVCMSPAGYQPFMSSILLPIVVEGCSDMKEMLC